MFKNLIHDGMKFHYLCQRDDVLESVQIENLWVRATQKRSGIVRHGDSSEDIDAQLSEVEDDGEMEYRSEITITKIWRQTWENWDRSNGQESKGIGWRWRRKRYLLPVERKRPMFEGKPVQFPAWEKQSCAETRTRMPPHFPSPRCHEVEVCRRKEVS